MGVDSLNSEIHRYRKPFVIESLRVLGAESNTSRVARICWKYQIPPTRFFKQYLDYAPSGNRSYFDFEVASHLNSHTPRTIEMEKRLCELIVSPSLEIHSYSFLSELLDRQARGFLAKKKRWCLDCYKARLRVIPDKMANGVFDDLYWSIDAIRVCMLHGSELVDRCYRCRKPQPYISTIVEPGFCHHCFAFLGDGYAKLVDPEYAQSQVVQYHMLYISSFDELRPDVGQLRRNLHALREAHPMGDSENLGPLVGVSGDVVRKWRTGKLKPRLESLGKLSGALGLRGIHQLFLSERDFLRRVVLQKNLPLRFNARPEYRSIETDYQIERLFAAMLTGEVETMSRSQIASRFSVSEGYLTYNFGAELRMLSQKHRNRKVYEKELRDKDPNSLFIGPSRMEFREVRQPTQAGC